MTLKVKIPKHFFYEREYTIQVLFAEFLGLNLEIQQEQRQHVEILLPNGEVLILRDSFFLKTTEERGYLRPECLPSKPVIFENSLVCFYGSPDLKRNNKVIDVHFDIIASSFFLLSRWEEALSFSPDKHGRFSAYNSVIYKFQVLDRPLINEYLDWFVKIFTELGYKVDLKSREFRFFPTHDVDSIHYWHNSSHFLRSFIGDTLKRKKPLLAMRNLYRYLKLIFNLGRDPFDTFDRIMDISEKYGFCSAFYFLGAGDTVYDQNYKVAEKEAQSIADNIRNRQHELGIHPCYKSSTNFNILQNQYEELNREFKIKVKEGRQHYLKIKVPETWRYWSELGLKVDSSMAFHDREGFRCGTCYEFPVFDVYKRQTLSLRERPLTIMECTLIDYRKMSLDEAMETIYKYIDIVSRYRGDFVFLWHNSSFESFPEYQAMYEKTLEYAYSKTNVVSE